MSSLEDKETQKIVKENIINNEIEDRLKIDLEKFSEKCRITNENVGGKESINSGSYSQADCENTLQTRKDRVQSTKTKIYSKFTHPCVPKINCPEKVVRSMLGFF